jgi:hypothetical protein
MKNTLAVLLILSSIGIFYFIVIPAYGEIQTLRDTKAGYDQALSHSQEAQGVRDAVETKYNNMPAADLKRLESFLPNSIDNIRLIIEIDKVAGRYNMSLSDAKVNLIKEAAAETIGESTAPTIAYGTGKLDFSVTGTYEAYISFLKDLEQSLRLINVTSVSLSGVTSGVPGAAPAAAPAGAQDVYTYKTSLNTYWLK